MKILTISNNHLELARTHLKKPILTIGRSPTCDVVLRAPGVQAIHFLIEWIGAGTFNPNKGVWSIVDLSKTVDVAPEESGGGPAEGVVFSEKPTEAGGFLFTCVDDRLESVEEIGGKIVENLASGPTGKCEILELIQVRADSGAIEEVRHVPVRQVAQKEQILPKIREFKVEWSGKQAKDDSILRILLEEMPGAEIFNRGYRVTLASPSANLRLRSTDILKIRWRGRDFFLRFVKEINSPPIPRDVFGDPLLRKLLVSVGALALLILYFSRNLPVSTKPVEKPVLRIARVEIPKPPEPPTPERTETPPPEPPKPPESEAPPEPPKVAKAEPAKPVKPKNSHFEAKKAASTSDKAPKSEDKKASAVVDASLKKSGKMVAPSFVKKPEAAVKAGLNSPAKVKDVNAVGLLGALKNLGPKGKGVQVDKIINDGIVTESISGASASKIVLKNPPTGTLGAKRDASPKSSNASNLSAASTTLSGVKKYDPHSEGSLALKGEPSGVRMGADLVGDSGSGGKTGIGSLDSAEFSVEGGGLDRETVRRVIASYRSQIRTCYERALLTRASLEGRIVYDWRITPDGPVVTATIAKSTVDSANLASCVLDVIKKMSFPRAANNRATRVIYPFVFQGRK